MCIQSLVLTLLTISTTAFQHPIRSSLSRSSQTFFRRDVAIRMSNVEDEVAALRAAAAKAREESDALMRAMGKETTKTPAASSPVAVKARTYEELLEVTASVDFTNGNAATQKAGLEALAQEGDLVLWNAAAKGSAGLTSQRPYPVSLDLLERRSDGKLTGEKLGMGGDKDVSLEDFQDLTIGVVVGSTALAIGSLALLPENIGSTFCYLFALIPVLFVGIGSTSPGIIAAAIVAVRGSESDKVKREDRILRHEAAHFLCGYLCGLPIKQYSITDGFPCVEFFPSGEEDAGKREFNAEEIAALSIVALSGSVAEVMEFEQARGGENDLLELNNMFRRSKEFIGAQKQQDLTRWGALASYQLLKANAKIYERLVGAFKKQKTVAECIAVIEERT